MMRQSDLIFSTSSLEVGYDDPDMTLVYQHYAPINLASFVQRKGRGGRGADDRPLTGITLSPYSPRDSWYFRRPEQMIDATGFEIPLNMDNYFVRRGQAIAALLDGVARWKAMNQDRPPTFQSGDMATLVAEAAKAADSFTREVLGPNIYTELGVRDIAGLWSMGYSARTDSIDLNGAPRYWGWRIPITPRLLFQTINLPVLNVLVDGKAEPDKEDISLALATVAPGNMTRRYSFEDFHWIVPRDGRFPWFTGSHNQVQEEELLHGTDSVSFLCEIPKAVRDAIGEDFHPKLSRPRQIRLDVAGTRRGDWVPMWGYDRSHRHVVPIDGNPTAVRIQEKSQASLRGFQVVHADKEKATDQQWSLPPTFGKLFSFVALPGQAAHHRIRASRLFWGADTTLRLDDRNQPEETLTQFFVHPETLKPMFSGYSVETEGIQLYLDTDTLERFTKAEAERLHGSEEERWLKGRLFRYLLSTNSAAAGLNLYHAIRLSEVLQSAAGREDLREELRRLMRFWDGARLGRLLEQTFESILLHHPLLTKKRIETLSEAVAGNSYRAVIQKSYRDAGDTEVFARYLHSLVLNGIAIRLHQMFVLHGRGDEARVLAHSKSPMEFGKDASDTISVFENGMHGDGTTRTFLRHLEEVAESWRGGSLAECPSAQEDLLLEQVMVQKDKHSAWRQLNRNRLPDMQKLANDLAVDGSHTALDRVITMLYGSELVGDERFELFELHTEIREVREQLRGEMRRIPSVWELVSAAVQRATSDSPQVPRLAALNRAYAGLNDASQEESFSSGARLADQVHRLSANLCVDGCQACLHTAGVFMDASAGEASVSRLVLARYSEFLFGSANARTLE
jgi:hypothetical protein